MLNNIARIQRALRQAHLDAILLTNENDRRFATGFPSSDGTVIVTVHQAFFIRLPLHRGRTCRAGRYCTGAAVFARGADAHTRAGHFARGKRAAARR